MALLLLLAARTLRWASLLTGARCCRSPLWLTLALLLVACGQTVAAAPLEPNTPAPAKRPTSVLLSTASTTAQLAMTAARVAATPQPSAVAATATVTVAPSQVRFAPVADPSGTTTLPPTATPTAQLKAQPTLGAFSITPLPNATLVTPNPTAVAPQPVGSPLVNVWLHCTD